MTITTPAPFVFQRFPETDDELWYFVLLVWGVKLPRVAVCPGHSSPFQAFADAYFARHPVNVWKASRGFGGKTFTLSLLGMTELITLGAFITILGGSGAQSMRVHETMTEMWESARAPKHLLAKDPTKFDTYLTNGGKARTLMASQKSVRGAHPQRLRLDEIDEMDLEILTAAQGQPMRKLINGKVVNTNTVMSSTHQYPDGTMTWALKTAKERGWPTYHWCYRETSHESGWLDPGEVERKRMEISQYMWDTEYELQEPSLEGRAMDTDAVNAMFDPALGVFEGKDGEYIEIEAPRADRDYVTGADWAKEKDWTVICTWDSTDADNWRLVAYERIGRRPWPVMVGRLSTRWKWYGGKVVHDATGIGNVVRDYIEIPKGARVEHLIDVTMGGRVRADMLSNYVSAVESGHLKAPQIEHPHDEHKYCTVDDMYGSGHLPDSVSSFALAWSARNTWRKVIGAKPDISIKRPSSPWRSL